MWFLTVFSEMNSVLAISLFAAPRATSRSTSISRSVSLGPRSRSFAFRDNRPNSVTSIAAICGGPVWLQIALFFVVSIVCLAATRPLVKKLLRKDVTATNADRVLGQTARVTESIDNAVPTGAVYVGGMTWTARSESGQPIPRNAQVKIVRMEGVRLFVEPV